MKIVNAKIIALYIALLASVIAGAVNLIIFNLGPEWHITVVAGSVILVFAAVYLVAWLLLSNFLFQKINPIYKTINSLKESEKTLRKELDKKDSIDDLNREVEHWASGKTREIDQLKEMEQYRKEFLGNVSHELKTPIFNIQGYLQTLLEGDNDNPEKNRTYLERAKKSAGRLINIVGDLDTISRLDTGEIQLQFENFDIVELTREVFDLQDMRTKEAEINLKLKNEKSGPIIVHADRKRIQEAMVNLVVNSIIYGRKNGTTTVGFTDMEDKILVEVSDTGLGISNNDLPRLFERFYRVDKTRSRNQGGTGLGLAIVKHIMEAHNQSVNVKSKENEGSTFSFTLMKGR